MNRLAPLWMTLIALLAVGCSDAHGRGDDAGPPDSDAGTSGRDAGITGRDAGITGRDAGPPRGDAGTACAIPEPEQHRPGGEACPTERDDSPIVDMAEDWWECTSHDECTEGDNGRCTGNAFHGYYCTYDACFGDSDCGAGPCICRGASGGVGNGGANRCLAGTCQTDSDCGAGGWCSPTLGSCGDYGGVVGYYCHTCEDECTDDSDCGGYPSYCAFDEASARWRCQDSHCAG